MTRTRRAEAGQPPIAPVAAFLLLLRSPSRGVQTLRSRTVRPSAAVAFLVAVGVLRGVLDIPWIYWQAGQLDALGPSLAAPAWYLLNAGPFVAAEVTTALLRWVLFATLVFLAGRFVGGRGSFPVVSGVFAALLGITLATIAIDYLHVLLPVPLVRFSASARYNPVVGVGQIATSLWIGRVTYLLARLELGLPGWPAAMIGALVPLVNTGLFLIVARVLFTLAPDALPRNYLMAGLNVGFVAVGAAAFAALLWWGRARLLSDEGTA